jgi:hypothetical protein
MTRRGRVYIRTTIVPSYREQEYVQIRKMMSDGARFPKTYQEWLDRTNRKVEALERQGHSIKLITIDPAAFAAWCEEKRRGPNSRSRLDFAASLLVGGSTSQE